jgi:CheY-like chemotaxis protein
MTKYKEKLPTINLMMEKVRVRAECSGCRMVATREEIDREIEILWPSPERQKLEKFAAYRVQGLGRAGCGRTAEDLFQDAWLSTFIGAENAGEGKKFYKNKVNFAGHLRWAMRNISSALKKRSKAWEPYSESDIITRNAEGDKMSPLENVPSSDPAADRCLSAKEEFERMCKRYANDKEVSALIQAGREGMTTAREIMQERNLTKRRYEAALKRLRGKKTALVVEAHDKVLELVVRWLKAVGFAVLTARTADEGLRLYGECGPFDVVMISYSPKLNGVELAMDIRKKNTSQRMVITTTYSSEEDVVRPRELIHVPILLKPFGKSELLTVLPSSLSTVREKPANCFRPKGRRAGAARLRLTLSDGSASRLPKQKKTS